MPAKVTMNGRADPREFQRLLAEIERCYHVQSRVHQGAEHPNPGYANGHANGAAEEAIWSTYAAPADPGLGRWYRDAKQALAGIPKGARVAIGFAWVGLGRFLDVARRVLKSAWFKIFDLALLVSLAVTLVLWRLV